jgi:hypothetical protein
MWGHVGRMYSSAISRQASVRKLSMDTVTHFAYNVDQTFEYLKNRQYFIHVEGPYIMPVMQQILQ